MLSKLSKLLTGVIVFSILSIPVPRPKREPRFFSQYRLKNLFKYSQREEERPKLPKLDLKYQRNLRIKPYDLNKLVG